jgi:hypothetical protein
MFVKKILLLLGAGAFIANTNAQTARIQAIHNSADAAASTVDVYLDGNLLIDDFAFRTASPFIDAPAGVTINLAIAPSTSTSVADAIATFPFTLTANETYVLVAEGIVSPTGYSPDATTAAAFDIKVYGLGRETASITGNTDVLVHHGATDAPTVDVRERTLGATVVDDASYGDFTAYLELPTADYILDVQTSDGLTTVASYSAPLAGLGLTNQALVVLASGFLNPAVNSNGPAFGLWVALPTGGALIELPAAVSPTARVQVIHNSADAAASLVDVYLDGALLIDDFAFRTASSFIDAPATQAISVAIAPSNSTSVAQAIATFSYNLAINETYVLVAEGIVSPTGYSPDATTAAAFDIKVYGLGRETAVTLGNTDLLVHHGATDAPTVDVDELNAGNLVNDASYGDFAGYLELPTADYRLRVKDATGTTTVAAYLAPLATLNLDDQALVVVASGFLNPAVNSNGPAFGLWVALSTGGALIELPEDLTVSIVEQSDNTNVTVYPNPAKDVIIIKGIVLGNAEIKLMDVAGKLISNKLYSTSENSINISKLPRGSYHIMINNDSNPIHANFIKL